MEGVLPFEYGYLYKIISNPNHLEINNSLHLDGEMNGYFSNSGYGISGSSYHNGFSNTKYFHPIGYIQSSQKVILEVVVEEVEMTNGHMYMSGMSFQTTTLQKNFKKISRAECDVNVFIKNFEKIL